MKKQLLVRIGQSSTILFGAMTLVACQTMPEATTYTIGTTPLTVRMPHAAFAKTININSTDTFENIEAKHGGTVVVWRPAQGFAILGIPKTVSSQNFAALNQSPEANQNRFLASNTRTWMNGQSILWAEGQSILWAEGQSILWAEGQYRLMPQNTEVWKKIGLDQAQLKAKKLGRNVKIAVIDTGVDLQHPMLQGALVPASQMWDFVNNDASPQEEGTPSNGGYGHGTSVASIILQIAPAAKIMPLQVLGADGSGDVTNLAAAIDWAVANDAQIIHLSLGSETFSTAVETALQAATNQGVLVVSSSGNGNNTNVSYPASHAHIQNDTLGWQRLSVTSVDNNYEKSAFANYASGLELAAFGEQIYSAAPNTRMASWSGTSMAAPMATGAIALALGEQLSGEKRNLINELQQTAGGELYNNATNETYKDLVGKGNLNIAAFLENTITSGN